MQSPADLAALKQAQRDYLASALKHAGVDMLQASLAIGKNKAYIQQYLADGKPQFLREEDRDVLVRLYGIDGDRLKPPVKEPKRKPPSRRTAATQGGGDLPHEVEQVELLLFIWSRLDVELKTAIMTLLQSVTIGGSKAGVS